MPLSIYPASLYTQCHPLPDTHPCNRSLSLPPRAGCGISPHQGTILHGTLATVGSGAEPGQLGVPGARFPRRVCLSLASSSADKVTLGSLQQSHDLPQVLLASLGHRQPYFACDADQKHSPFFSKSESILSRDEKPNPQKLRRGKKSVSTPVSGKARQAHGRPRAPPGNPQHCPPASPALRTSGQKPRPETSRKLVQ